MRIAMISPLPPEQSGIADYAEAFCCALKDSDVEVEAPIKALTLELNSDLFDQQMKGIDWGRFDVVHGELGGGRIKEFKVLEWLAKNRSDLPITATVHDPERLVWKPVELPWILAGARHIPRVLYQALVLMIDPWTLARERRLAHRLSQIVTLTRAGAECLEKRMRLTKGSVMIIAHGNREIESKPLPPLPPEAPLKLLYFGFIYKGKGIEDLIDAVAILFSERPEARNQIILTLAGGTEPDITFGGKGSYIDELKKQLEGVGLTEEYVNWQLNIDAELIPSTIQTHHILVLPYKESKKLAYLGRMLGTSGALSWANSCGRGVISSDARAFVEEVSYGNGLVYPQGDSKKLALELGRLMENPELIVVCSESAAKLGVARCWNNTAAAFRKLFQSQLGKVDHE